LMRCGGFRNRVTNRVRVKPSDKHSIKPHFFFESWWRIEQSETRRIRLLRRQGPEQPPGREDPGERLLATRLAARIGFPVPPVAVVELREELVAHTADLVMQVGRGVDHRGLAAATGPQLRADKDPRGPEHVGRGLWTGGTRTRRFTFEWSPRVEVSSARATLRLPRRRGTRTMRRRGRRRRRARWRSRFADAA